eukprot:jgi/Bigna1/81362/fgenesh1_pg.80_\
MLRVSCQTEGLVLQKATVDLALAVGLIIWIPSMVVKVSRVSRHSCYLYWKPETCSEYVTKSLATPSIVSLFVISVFIMVYYYFWREIRNNTIREVPELSRFYLYSYLAIFLWLHIYWSCAWIVACGSMYFWHMIILIAFGIVQDAIVLNRILDLRAPQQDHPSKLRVDENMKYRHENVSGILGNNDTEEKGGNNGGLRRHCSLSLTRPSYG